MNKEEFVKILTGVGKLYDKELDQEVLTMWLSFFKENTTNEFKQAINEHIKTSRYFPTIADIKEKIYKSKNKEESNSDLWERLLEAIRRSSYYYDEEFDKLPMLLKKYVGSSRQLQELAMMDSDTIHTIVKGQFLKQIELLKKTYKEEEICNNLLQEKNIIQIERVE